MNKSHGHSRTITHTAWTKIKGDRCSSWDVYENFLSDVGQKEPGQRLVKEDENLPHSSVNSSWMTHQEHMDKKHSRHLGCKFNEWTILELVEGTGGKGIPKKVVCKCSCGTTAKRPISDIVGGQSKRCTKCKGITHNMSRTREYNSWDAMIQRCTNPKAKHYEYYGGRGVTFDPRWRDFKEFYKDMGSRPENTTLDKDIKGGIGCKYYCKDNCIWATNAEQASNKRPRRDNF